ncbi:hypothetical protein ACEWY4_019077 [Coilia grayii]|uniref:Transcription factor Adf-1-like n=1 Tax=Coilia grayii TaxID=363190 RepID=A0ABD1JF38_9TELE
MEETLIVAVSGNPVIYDTALPTYKDVDLKRDAWLKVAQLVGRPEDECRKRWKSLRDQFVKERKKCREASRSGAGGNTPPKWRYIPVPPTPHFQGWEPEMRPPQAKRASVLSAFEKAILEAIRAPSTPPPPAALSSVDEDEVFFKSLIPMMRRLSTEDKEDIKFKIYGMVFEATRQSSDQ